MNVIFLGAPGSGKGTLAEPIKKEFGLEHFSTGDMLRKQVAEGTELGLKAKKIMDEGGLVSDDIIIAMAADKIAKTEGGLLFDGFPRTLEQAKALDGIAKIDAVIDLETPVDEIIERICTRRVCPACKKIFSVRKQQIDTCDACGAALIQRPDDTEATVRKRYDVYLENTAPLIDYYKEQGILFTVDVIDFDEIKKLVSEHLNTI